MTWVNSIGIWKLSVVTQVSGVPLNMVDANALERVGFVMDSRVYASPLQICKLYLESRSGPARFNGGIGHGHPHEPHLKLHSGGDVTSFYASM